MLARKSCARVHRAIALCAMMVAALAVLRPASAWAYYIGPSYLKIDGISGGAEEPAHKNWVRAEANYWTARPELREIRGITGKYSGLKFTGPRAPAAGPDFLAIAVDKRSPALAALMARCRDGGTVPEVIFAESAESARHPQEHGPRPSDVPAFYEYRLSGVRLTCPVVSDAPEQAFGLHFEQIEWLNFRPQDKPREISASPARLMPAPRSGSREVFVVSWFAPVSDSREDQCPVMNTKPSQADYYALMTPDRAKAQRANLAGKGGADTTLLPYRGPDEMNVTMLPGTVPDPGHAEPQVDVVRGFNLDDDDGSGPAPAWTRPHKNYVSPEGETGIDNQLFTVQGCIEGWRRNGFLPMIGNELRRAGGLSILIEISGIDDWRNDDEVAVTILYSTDPMRRAGASKEILSDYTFRVNDSPEYSQDFARFRGRIVDGVVITEPLDKIYMHEGPATTWGLSNARMRLQRQPDGTLKALLGGYRDWREYLAAAFFRSSDYENTIGFQSPALYNAVKRAADGLKDPVTGEFTGISAAYELEGVPAFIPPSQDRKLIAGLALEPAK
jgi:hypothetical protein